MIWKQGLLRKEICLCHGAPGSILALNDPRRREPFLVFSTEEMVQRGVEAGTSEPSSHPSSLYRGLTGRIGAFHEFAKGTGGYPGYNDM